MNIFKNRIEVMNFVEKSMHEFFTKYLKPIETNWQPTDLLPDASRENFQEEIREIQALARDMDYDLWAVLIGDMITEEALPTYESWLMGVTGMDQDADNGWAKWIRAWTAEENRHGDLLNKYLYLSGRVNMREVETTTQYLLKDGFNPGTGADPYRNFVYTSFQELATNISHRRVASLSKKSGNNRLAKICGLIASDEARHARAYIHFVDRIFQIDPSEMMLAFEDMMKKKIAMPASLIRESGGKKGELFKHFSDAAQRMQVYTSQDYIDILKSLLQDWKIDAVTELNDKAEKARDYLMGLPKRLEIVSKRLATPTKSYEFKWIAC
jgi:acyl-[acyl-carrier-protein] desaturase